ncbi:hypothetical protein [Neptunicella sp. SCSIO 80796]|uniref:hypothetical protein n=1 Tax=Neptunicella plasticusilytica TaxID=3117012 RepID=UPI003A4D4D4B
MRQKYIQYTGWAVLVIALIFTAIFAISVQIDPNPQVWFTPEYYLQFIPLYIAVTFLLCGLFVVSGFSGVNVYLALFGHAASEEILFSWMGLTTTPLPTYATYILFPFSCLALWVAYANILDKNRVSSSEAIFGFVFSTAFILLPRYF